MQDLPYIPTKRATITHVPFNGGYPNLASLTHLYQPGGQTGGITFAGYRYVAKCKELGVPDPSMIDLDDMHRMMKHGIAFGYSFFDATNAVTWGWFPLNAAQQKEARKLIDYQRLTQQQRIDHDKKVRIEKAKELLAQEGIIKIAKGKVTA